MATGSKVWLVTGASSGFGRAIVGPTRAFAAQTDGAQVGDPAKAARAIAEAVDAGVPTLRLPLGADAVSGIRQKIAFVAADVDRTERVARATTF